MFSTTPLKYLAIFLLAFFIFSCDSTEPQKRERISFNNHWLFEKTQDTLAYQMDYDDSNWRRLSVPHDWAIEGPFKPEYNSRTGGLPVFGMAWYRKYFTIDPSKKGSIITLEFDGIMSNATIYVNGKKVYHRHNGYIGFEIDITPFINFNKKNCIAVLVDPKPLSARWYSGAGIYRNVWMEIKNPIHIAHWGSRISTPIVTEDMAKVEVKTKLSNKDLNKGPYKLKTTLYDNNNKQVAEDIIKLGIDEPVVEVSQTMEIENPKLWHFERPNLYKAVSILYKNDNAIDNTEVTFGVRTIKYTREGFFLNGKKEKIHGVCLHNDLGPLGAAVNYRATERQLQIMKKMGVNAIRTSHNPTSPEQLELCDKLGLLVQGEAFDVWKLPKTKNDYHTDWDAWHRQDLKDMIRRDYNHPSIIMWSIGNEIKEQKEPYGADIAKELVAICHDEDPTRPTTAGFNQLSAAIKNGLAAAVDLVGANYKPTQYSGVMKQHPTWIVYGSETASAVSSRGVYQLPLQKYDKDPSLQVNSYDIIAPPWAYPPDIEFHFQDALPQVIGNFMWTGFDYLGEPTPYGGKDNETTGSWNTDWPARSSYFGAVDLSGFPKDRFYLYQSQWTTEPMVHLLPHWNWENSGIKTVPVYCYTNADSAELFLNGKSLGKKVKGVDTTRIPVSFHAWGNRPKYFDSPYRLSWNVPYTPGELKVVAYRNDSIVATESVRTAKARNKIRLIPDRNVIKADGQDLSFITVKIEDKDSNFCPLADNKVTFKVTGPGTIEAVGNGNATSTEPFQANYRKAFNGLCLLVVKSKKDFPGDITIEAMSEGLVSSTIQIKTKS
ncbi:glycoside hydrolase family 2 TIM barrel-domain containing protein [Gaetbulibacter aestuarii]|uniref:Glycoside hydrolase family 2 TIM barrel-domain containing protein n=1 Tax=Gaetbulibacter aestuarii TaxID=1502358 RepID=A0ABW7MY30_9FLAO